MLAVYGVSHQQGCYTPFFLFSLSLATTIVMLWFKNIYPHWINLVGGSNKSECMQSPIKPNDEEKKRRRLACPHNTVGYLGERVRIKFQSTVNGMLFFLFSTITGGVQHHNSWFLQQWHSKSTLGMGHIGFLMGSTCWKWQC